MFLFSVSFFKSLSLKKAYLNGFLPLTLLISLFFHKFAAVFFVFAATGFYFLKEASIKGSISSILKSPPLHLLIAFWVWATITLLWTINFENGLLTSIKFFGMISLGIIIFSSLPGINNKNIKNIFSFLFLGIVFVIIAYLIMPLLNQNYEKPLAYFLALFFFPTALYLDGSLYRNLNFLLLILFGFTLFAMKLSGAQSGLIGFLMGTLMFLLTIFRPQRTTLFLKIFTFLWTLFTPLLMLVLNNTHLLVKYIDFTGASLFHRFCIWTFVTNKIFEHPIIGWGVGSSKNFPSSDLPFFTYLSPEQLQLFDFLGESKWYVLGLNNMPLHPHNNTLQVYLELGLVGGVIYALFLASVFQLFLKVFKDKVVLAAANAMAVLTLVIFNMSHSIWHMWLLSWIILSFATLYAVSIYRSRKLECASQES